MGMERDKRLNRRKLIFQIMNKLWLVAVAAVAGAVLAAGIYYAKGIVKQPERYEAKFTIYLTFEEEGAEVNIQYYNSYTWKELVKDDPIMDYVMAHLPEDYSRDEVNRAVEMSTPSDVRVLLGTVTTSDPVRSETIAQAMAGGILHFRDKVDVFTDMELWRMDPARRVLIDAETVRVAVVGGVLGALVALVVLWIYYLTADRIDTTEEFTDRFQIPVIGIYDGNGQPFVPNEEEANRKQLLMEGVTAVIDLDAEAENISVYADPDSAYHCSVYRYDALESRSYDEVRRATAVILAVRASRPNGNAVRHAISQLEIQGIHLTAAILCRGDRRFLKKYYGKRK